MNMRRTVIKGLMSLLSWMLISKLLALSTGDPDFEPAWFSGSGKCLLCRNMSCRTMRITALKIAVYSSRAGMVKRPTLAVANPP